MKILFDSESSQMQVQVETGTRLNTLFGAIQSEGWTWAASTDPITTAELAGYDVLAILTRYRATAPGTTNPFPPDQSFAYTPAEIAAIQAFVQGGKGLLLVSNHDFWTTNDHVLAAAFGVNMQAAFFHIQNNPLMVMPVSASVAPSPVLYQVDKVIAHDSCALSTTAGTAFTPLVPIPPAAVDGSPLHLSPQGQFFAIAFGYGSGRVIVAGNSGMFGDDGSTYPAPGLMPYGNNLMFMLNALKYLGGLPIP
ncbi:MAG TPA: hypothetical protein VIH93_10120 [Thermoanaerobaculia bacterium]